MCKTYRLQHRMLQRHAFSFIRERSLDHREQGAMAFECIPRQGAHLREHKRHGLSFPWSHRVYILRYTLWTCYLSDGVPWWCAIIVGTVFFRACTVPIAVIQRRRLVRLLKAQVVVKLGKKR
ncbi:hypothetical protein BC829DRAFT_30752 [Chytridium lagenaria]|nr:hypothetical protein BC829DRAFT_30752 [Chytridium lagenaria]